MQLSKEVRWQERFTFELKTCEQLNGRRLRLFLAATLCAVNAPHACGETTLPRVFHGHKTPSCSSAAFDSASFT